MTKIIEICWAFIKANLYTLRSPLKYQVISKTCVHLRGQKGVIEEEYIFIGVMQDIPDVTDHSIIHKLVPVKTFYGEWEDVPPFLAEGYMPKVPIGEDDREFVSLEEFFEKVKSDE